MTDRGRMPVQLHYITHVQSRPATSRTPRAGGGWSVSLFAWRSTMRYPVTTGLDTSSSRGDELPPGRIPAVHGEGAHGCRSARETVRLTPAPPCKPPAPHGLLHTNLRCSPLPFVAPVCVLSSGQRPFVHAEHECFPCCAGVSDGLQAIPGHHQKALLPVRRAAISQVRVRQWWSYGQHLKARVNNWAGTLDFFASVMTQISPENMTCSVRVG